MEPKLILSLLLLAQAWSEQFFLVREDRERLVEVLVSRVKNSAPTYDGSALKKLSNLFSSISLPEGLLFNVFGGRAVHAKRVFGTAYPMQISVERKRGERRKEVYGDIPSVLRREDVLEGQTSWVNSKIGVIDRTVINMITSQILSDGLRDMGSAAYRKTKVFDSFTPGQAEAVVKGMKGISPGVTDIFLKQHYTDLLGSVPSGSGAVFRGCFGEEWRSVLEIERPVIRKKLITVMTSSNDVNTKILCMKMYVIRMMVYGSEESEENLLVALSLTRNFYTSSHPSPPSSVTMKYRGLAESGEEEGLVIRTVKPLTKEVGMSVLRGKIKALSSEINPDLLISTLTAYKTDERVFKIRRNSSVCYSPLDNTLHVDRGEVVEVFQLSDSGMFEHKHNIYPNEERDLMTVISACNAVSESIRSGVAEDMVTEGVEDLKAMVERLYEKYGSEMEEIVSDLNRSSAFALEEEVFADLSRKLSERLKRKEARKSPEDLVDVSDILKTLYSVDKARDQ